MDEREYDDLFGRLSSFYILRDRKPVRTQSLREWGEFFESPDRIVAQHDVAEGVRVSTVFLGLDHRHFGQGCPLLFETMVFGSSLDGACERYCTWEEAERGHTEMLVRVTDALELKL